MKYLDAPNVITGVLKREEELESQREMSHRRRSQQYSVRRLGLTDASLEKEGGGHNPGSVGCSRG